MAHLFIKELSLLYSDAQTFIISPPTILPKDNLRTMKVSNKHSKLKKDLTCCSNVWRYRMNKILLVWDYFPFLSLKVCKWKFSVLSLNFRTNTEQGLPPFSATHSLCRLRTVQSSRTWLAPVVKLGQIIDNRVYY